MKTVMKKMFSLLLVAVLMVGAMPFQAFAATTVTLNLITESGGTPIATTTISVDETLAPADFSAAVQAEAVANWGANYDFQAASSEIKSGNQVYARMTPKACNKAVSCPSPADHYPTCGTNCTGNFGCGTETHKSDCKSQYVCPNCNVKGDHLNTACPNLIHPCCKLAATEDHAADCITRCSRAYNCTNAKHYDDCQHNLCNTEGCELNEGHSGEHKGVPCGVNNCTFNLGHSTKHSYQCQTAGCDKVINHPGNHSNEPTSVAGSSTLKVYVNLYTGDVKTGTYELARYEGISDDTVVYSFIADRREQLRAKLPSGYDWSGHIYDADNKGIAEDANTEVGTGRTVHINAYSDADYVYIYVHTGRTFSNIRVIKMDGKKVGETITRKEVMAVVDDYYAVSGLKMYPNSVWPSYVHYDEVQAVDSLTANAGITEIHVVVSGVTNGTGTTYTADSTNPKTGDMIFMPAIVLGLSVSALAVLFFLNKKRAY